MVKKIESPDIESWDDYDVEPDGGFLSKSDHLGDVLLFYRCGELQQTSGQYEGEAVPVEVIVAFTDGDVSKMEVMENQLVTGTAMIGKLAERRGRLGKLVQRKSEGGRNYYTLQRIEDEAERKKYTYAARDAGHIPE